MPRERKPLLTLPKRAWEWRRRNVHNGDDMLATVEDAYIAGWHARGRAERQKMQDQIKAHLEMAQKLYHAPERVERAKGRK